MNVWFFQRPPTLATDFSNPYFTSWFSSMVLISFWSFIFIHSYSYRSCEDQNLYFLSKHRSFLLSFYQQSYKAISNRSDNGRIYWLVWRSPVMVSHNSPLRCAALFFSRSVSFSLIVSSQSFHRTMYSGRSRLSNALISVSIFPFCLGLSLSAL